MSHTDTEQYAAVETVKKGEFVKRVNKDGSAGNKVYRRGDYDASSRKYSLEDYEDANREVFVKKGTILFVGFSY